MQSTTLTVPRDEAGVRPASARAAAAASFPLTIDIHRTMEPIEAEWRRLERQPFVSVHQTFDWCRSWIVHAGSAPLLVSARGHDGEQLILPLEIVSRTGFKFARFIANPFSNINTGLHSADFARHCGADTFDRLRSGIREAAPGIDLVVLEKMPRAWRGVANPLFHLDHVESQNRAFQATLRPGFDQVLAQVNGKKRRKKFRLSERRLEETGGYEIVHSDDAGTAAELLRAFYAQKRRRFEKQGKFDVFARPHVQAFFGDLARMAPGGGVRPLRLSAVRLADGRIGAIAGISSKDGHHICQFGSIDEEIGASLSIGEFLFYRLIAESCGPDAACFDFGIGDEAYKRAWCDQETIQYNAYLPLTVRGRMLAGAMKAATRAKVFVKANPLMDRSARALQRIVAR